MSRGKASRLGATRIAKNGYHYTKATDPKTGNRVWRLTHHIVAEQEILKRPLSEHERVRFRTADKLNMEVGNIEVVSKGKGSIRRRIAAIETRIEELQQELIELRSQAPDDKLNP